MTKHEEGVPSCPLHIHPALPCYPCCCLAAVLSLKVCLGDFPRPQILSGPGIFFTACWGIMSVSRESCQSRNEKNSPALAHALRRCAREMPHNRDP